MPLDTLLRVDHTLDPRLVPEGDNWCDCADAPWTAPKPATLSEHSPDCGFPVSPCTIRAHRVTVHEGCGREMPYRFCRCQPSGYTFDVERGWWVHYLCGWPTWDWLQAAGSQPPEHLLGVRPVTLHEFVPVPKDPVRKPPKNPPKNPKPPKPTAWSQLTDEQKRVNAAFDGAWVRD